MIRLASILIAVALIAGCGGGKLQEGGAYAPGTFEVVPGVGGVGTDTRFVPSAAPDVAFFAADAAYDLAYSTIDAAFKFEKDNRALLWKLTPDIKHALDAIRPKAWEINVQWAKARKAYMQHLAPANLSTLEGLLNRLQQLTTAATAAVERATQEQPTP